MQNFRTSTTDTKTSKDSTTATINKKRLIKGGAQITMLENYQQEEGCGQ